MIELRKTIHVDRPAAEVYAYLADPERIVEYVGPVKRIDQVTTATVEEGTRLTVHAGFLGIGFKQRAECTRVEPPQRFETRSVGGRFYFEAGFTLHPEEGGGTRIEGWGNASSPLFGLADRVLGFLIERQVDADFRRVKAHLDSAV